MDLWSFLETIKTFIQYAAPVVITFAVLWVGTWMIRGYISVASMIKFIFETPGRFFFIVILFLVVIYLWNNFSEGLGW